MEDKLDGQNSGQHVKIGAETHGSRNIIIIVGAVLAIGAVALFYKASASSDEPKLKLLGEFRAAFAQKCDSAEFGGEIPVFVKDQFLKSSRLQDEVQKQATLLASGTPCTEVEHALRAASFPMGAKH